MQEAKTHGAGVTQRVLLICRHNEIFLLLSVCSRLWTEEIRIWGIIWLPLLLLSLCFLITFLTENVLIYLWCCHLISQKKKRKKNQSPWLWLPAVIATVLFCSPPPPPLFKKLAVVFNQWVINYWGAAGWQDAHHDELTAARMLNM